jgi:hypothetical protein
LEKLLFYSIISLEDLNMKKNFFDLKSYFKNNYDYDYKNLEELLLEPFIAYEATGAHALFWIKDNDKKYLFKELDKNDYAWLGEVLAKKVADALGIPCAKYQVCFLEDKLGILSEKFTKKNETIILGAQIIQESLDKYPWLKEKSLLQDTEFLENYNVPNVILSMDNKNRLKYLYNNLNNLEQLWSIVDICLKLHNLESKENLQMIMDYLIRVFFFDILTFQCDRHAGNWGVIYNLETGKIDVPYLFDNSASFTLLDRNLKSRMNNFYISEKNYLNDPNVKRKEFFINNIYKDRMLLTASENDITNVKARKRRNNLEILDYFLKYSDDEFINLFNSYLEKFKKIDFRKYLNDIEIEQKMTIPEEIKTYITDLEKWNLFFLEEKINIYKKSKGSGLNA